MERVLYIAILLGEVLMDLKLDEGLRVLIESGKEKGYLTLEWRLDK